MKKSLIATGAASLAIAAMPVVGVFAADGPVQLVDTVRVTIDESCTFEATKNGQTMAPIPGATEGDPATINRTFAKNATLGEVVKLGGSNSEGVTNPSANAITVAATCNFDTPSGGSTTGTWQIKAASSLTMNGSGTNKINNSTSTTTKLESGNTSAWSMKIVAAEGVTIQGGYDDYNVMPAGSGVVVAKGSTSTTTDVTFTPEYRVYVGTDQPADTYTGTVTYTISSPAD